VFAATGAVGTIGKARHFRLLKAVRPPEREVPAAEVFGDR